MIRCLTCRTEILPRHTTGWTLYICCACRTQLALVALLAWCLLVPSLTGAETRLNLGIGVTNFQVTAPDGRWYQEAFPHEFQTTALALRGGLEYRLNEHWAIQGNYVRLGSLVAKSQFVADESYDGEAHRCMASCGMAHALHATELVQGPELTGAYTWTLGPVRPFVKAGLAALHHALTVPTISHNGQRNNPVHASGTLLTGVVGGGLCYGWLCADVTYYRGLASVTTPAYPIASDALLSLVYVSMPLGF